MNSQQLKRLMTRPHEYVKFVQTGRLPKGEAPSSPLIDLLTRLEPRDLGAIRGVTVDAALGYTGSRVFADAAQALRWIRPAAEMYHSYPASSWQDRRFTRPLKFSDLVRSSGSVPESLLLKYRALG